jgi:hypothetical protein
MGTAIRMGPKSGGAMSCRGGGGALKGTLGRGAKNPVRWIDWRASGLKYRRTVASASRLGCQEPSASHLWYGNHAWLVIAWCIRGRCILATMQEAKLLVNEKAQ